MSHTKRLKFHNSDRTVQKVEENGCPKIPVPFSLRVPESWSSGVCPYGLWAGRAEEMKSQISSPRAPRISQFCVTVTRYWTQATCDVKRRRRGLCWLTVVEVHVQSQRLHGSGSLARVVQHGSSKVGTQAAAQEAARGVGRFPHSLWREAHPVA